MGWLIFIGVICCLAIIYWLGKVLSRLQENSRKYIELKPKLDKLGIYYKELETKEVILQNRESAINSLVEERAKGFPWLVKAFDDFNTLNDSTIVDSLKYKKHPAMRASDEVRQISKERREAEKAARTANYLLDYCRYLAPWLDDYIGLDAAELEEVIHNIHSSWEKKEEEFDEEVKRQVGPKTYEALSPTQKLQRKLDWYRNKLDKSDWQIGREYERYIGYLYEKDGWKVIYQGKKGFEDLGRDLVCKRGNETEIIQCKRWAQEKTIHEKHIYYLFGTTVEYYLENFGDEKNLQLQLFPDLIRRRSVLPKLVTTAGFSPKAAQVAKVLGVSVEKVPFEDYPSVKCNVALRTGEKIFHLPFDQQYDTAQILEEKLECYVKTVAEAETLGFRHAYRWKGETE